MQSRHFYVSVANKGGSDLEAHVHSAKHKTAARGESSSSKVTDFFVSKTDTSVTAAEGTLAFLYNKASQQLQINGLHIWFAKKDFPRFGDSSKNLKC